MFIEILNWMLAHVPAFLRPGVTWLITGINRLVNHVSSRWNALGTAFVGWAYATWGWRDRLNGFLGNAVAGLVWLKTVFLPRFVGEAATTIRGIIDQTIRWLDDRVTAGLNALGRFIEHVREWAAALIQDVINWVSYWINETRTFLGRLTEALSHVLQGPEHLAEWLVEAMWRAFTRYMYAQRDRIAMWVTRESAAFTRWIAMELEQIIMRWL